MTIDIKTLIGAVTLLSVVAGLVTRHVTVEKEVDHANTEVESIKVLHKDRKKEVDAKIESIIEQNKIGHEVSRKLVSATQERIENKLDAMNREYEEKVKESRESAIASESKIETKIESMAKDVSDLKMDITKLLERTKDDE